MPSEIIVNGERATMIHRPDPEKSAAVLIGCSESDGMRPLPAVIHNLSDLRRLMMDDQVWGLPPERCQIRAEPRQPRDLIEAVTRASRQATDTLLVYFAGHGLLDEHSRLHLGLRETHAGQPHTAFPYEYLRAVLKRAPAKAKIIVLDCEYGGAVAEDAVVETFTAVRGAHVLTSAIGSETAGPPGEMYTALTGELIRLLRSGVPDAGPELGLDDIFRHLAGQLPAKGYPLPRQVVRTDLEGFVFAANRACPRPAIAGSPPTERPPTAVAGEAGRHPSDGVADVDRHAREGGGGELSRHPREGDGADWGQHPRVGGDSELGRHPREGDGADSGQHPRVGGGGDPGLHSREGGGGEFGGHVSAGGGGDPGLPSRVDGGRHGVHEAEEEGFSGGARSSPIGAVPAIFVSEAAVHGGSPGLDADQASGDRGRHAEDEGAVGSPIRWPVGRAGKHGVAASDPAAAGGRRRTRVRRSVLAGGALLALTAGTATAFGLVDLPGARPGADGSSDVDRSAGVDGSFGADGSAGANGSSGADGSVRPGTDGRPQPGQDSAEASPASLAPWATLPSPVSPSAVLSSAGGESPVVPVRVPAVPRAIPPVPQKPAPGRAGGGRLPAPHLTSTYAAVRPPTARSATPLVNELARPVLLTPVNGFGFMPGHHLTFSWRPVAGAASYAFEMQTSANGTDFRPAGVRATTGTSLRELPPRQYHLRWRVSAVAAAGQRGRPSAWWQIDTCSSCL